MKKSITLLILIMFFLLPSCSKKNETVIAKNESVAQKEETKTPLSLSTQEGMMEVLKECNIKLPEKLKFIEINKKVSAYTALFQIENVDEVDKKEIKVYSDNNSILQIMEISDDKKWVILISMPVKTEGRAEMTYLLADLQNRRIVNKELEKYAGNYMYFSRETDGHIYLNYIGNDFEEYKIELNKL
ncbi:MAG: hypothetical protein GX220_00815 [Treponema sp.]|nr:hypothetical protein [Treponema sp.]